MLPELVYADKLDFSLVFQPLYRTGNGRCLVGIQFAKVEGDSKKNRASHDIPVGIFHIFGGNSTSQATFLIEKVVALQTQRD